jgi:hypothetical protein
MNIRISLFMGLVLLSGLSYADNRDLVDCDPTITTNEDYENKLSTQFHDMVKLRNGVCETVLRSKQNANRANVIFRLIGSLIVVFSAVLPLVAGLQFKRKEIVLPFLAIGIAIFTGLNVFFDFQGTWSKSRLAQYQLSHEIVAWEQSISHAYHMKDGKKAILVAETATKKLQDAWKGGVLKRGAQYFDQNFSVPAN